MAKPKKSSKPSVKVKDLSVKKDPKGGLANKWPEATTSLPKFK